MKIICRFAIYFQNKHFLVYTAIITLLLTYSAFVHQVGAADLHQQESRYAHTPDTPISFGETLEGTINLSGELDSYTFSGEADDTVIIRMVDVPSSNFISYIRLYRPDATILCEGNNPTGGLAELICTLDASGVFTILVGDYYGDKVSDYRLYLQRLNNPGMTNPISYGYTQIASIDLETELDTYLFTGAMSDTVTIRMLETPSSNFLSLVRIFRPDGTLLCQGNDPTGGLAQTTCTFDTSGVFALLVGDYYGDKISDYGLYLQRLNNPGMANPISYGQTIIANIDLTTELDTYLFTGVMNDTFIIRMTETSNSNFLSHVRLYKPNGTLLCEAFSSGLAEVTCVLDTDGMYVITAGDYYGDKIQEYSISLTCLICTVQEFDHVIYLPAILDGDE